MRIPYQHIPMCDIFDHWGGGPAAMLDGFIDDSADQARERYCSFGGIIGLKEQLSLFEILWLNATHELQKPFRSTDCENGFDQFKDWDLPRRVNLMKSLVSLLVERRVWGYASVVSISEYREVFPEAAEKAPLDLCASTLMVAMANMAASISQSIRILFENGDYGASVLGLFKDLQHSDCDRGTRLLGIGFDSKRVVGLQAADLIAREAFKYFDNLGSREPRKPFLRLHKQMTFHRWTKEGLGKIKAAGYPRMIGDFARMVEASIL